MKGLGEATEGYQFVSFDGVDGNACAMITGTNTISIDGGEGAFADRQRSEPTQEGLSQTGTGAHRRMLPALAALRQPRRSRGPLNPVADALLRHGRQLDAQRPIATTTRPTPMATAPER